MNTSRGVIHNEAWRGLLVSVDPGIRVCGVACFVEGTLAWAQPVKSLDKSAKGADAYFAMSTAVRDVVWAGAGVPTHIAIETPEQYPGSPAPRSAVQALEGVVGAVGVALQGAKGVPVFGYKPKEWKRQVPKPIMYGRICSRLSQNELDAVPSVAASVRFKTSTFHQCLDAIGIGLHHLGRLRPQGDQ